jgi:hypothetical protein
MSCNYNLNVAIRFQKLQLKLENSNQNPKVAIRIVELQLVIIN